MRTVRDIPKLENIPVLLRTALNAPVKDGKVTTTYRLRAALPTIEYLRSKHARVILLSHVSSEVGIGGAKTNTLEPMWRAMQDFIPGITFCPVTVGAEAREAVRGLLPGEVLMLENVRRNVGEEKNDPKFAKELAELADLFVQDQFDVCHRKHAGIIGVPKLLPSYAGFLVEAEVKELSRALRPSRPALAIISGAKFSSKEPVIKKLLGLYDHVFVGGALANDFLRAKGYSLGASLLSDRPSSDFEELLKNPRLVVPVDAVVAPQGVSVEHGRLSDVRDIQAHEAVLDVGPKTIEALHELVGKAKAVLWSGPLGNYENGFMQGTEALARVIADSQAHSVIGGGDTIVAIEKLKLSGRFGFISTGGGAMLDFLSQGTLPGIEVLR